MNCISGFWDRFCSLRRIGAKYLARFIHTLLQKEKKHKKKALSLGSVSALERWSGSRIKQRRSIPKLLIMDNALISAMTDQKFGQVKKNKVLWGRILENAVGAKLYAILQEKGANLFYWRQRQEEVDYVIQIGDRLIAIEVKSAVPKGAESCLISFARRYKKAEPIIISPGKDLKDKAIKYIPIEKFFNEPAKSIGL